VAWICAVRPWTLILPVSTQWLGATVRRKLIKLSSKNHPERARMCALRMARLLTMLRYQIVFLAFWMALAPSLLESVSAEECLTTPQQLLEKKVSDRWKELHQKDNQPLFLTISAGQGNNLQFVGKKPDGSTWISGAMSICPSLGNKYQVKLDRIDKAPLFVGLKLRGMSDTIVAGGSYLKFGTGQHCGNPDLCIEFAPE
jgi:hypothetical protein